MIAVVLTAIAESESAHDANALTLSPTTSTMQAANLTQIKVGVLEVPIKMLLPVGLVSTHS